MELYQPPVEHPIALRMWNTAQRMADQFDGYLEAAGGNRYQYFIFVALDTLAQPSQRELAAAVGVDGATITHHLTAMESAGLVSRRRAEKDKRIQHVTLTESGDALWHKLEQAVSEYNTAQLHEMRVEELSQLAGLLDRIDHNCDAMMREGR